MSVIETATNAVITTTDIFNVLSWSLPADGSNPRRYQIFRDSRLIGTISGGAQRVFEDHNLNPKTSYSYLIVAEDEAEETLAVGIITLMCN